MGLLSTAGNVIFAKINTTKQLKLKVHAVFYVIYIQSQIRVTICHLLMGVFYLLTITHMVPLSKYHLSHANGMNKFILVAKYHLLYWMSFDSFFTTFFLISDSFSTTLVIKPKTRTPYAPNTGTFY